MKKKEVWKEYIRRKARGERYVAQNMARRLGVTRQRIYQILQEAHSEAEQYREMHRIQLDAYWNEKYKRLWKGLRGRRPEVVNEIKRLVCEMIWDGFSVTDIAEYTGRHHSTISHHAKDCDLDI